MFFGQSAGFGGKDIVTGPWYIGYISQVVQYKGCGCFGQVLPPGQDKVYTPTAGGGGPESSVG